MPLILALLAMPALSQANPNASYLVEVRPGARANFRDAPGGPVRKAYVMPGDPLIAEASKGGFTRVVFVSTGGTMTSGWIETARLRRLPTPAPAPAAWTGEWLSGDSSIEIRAGRAPGTLHLTGVALWGMHDPERVKNGAIHTGDIEGDVQPRGDRIDYSDGTDAYSCHVTLQLRGPYLLVDDNGNCGGANVTFTGIYRR